MWCPHGLQVSKETTCGWPLPPESWLDRDGDRWRLWGLAQPSRLARSGRILGLHEGRIHELRALRVLRDHRRVPGRDAFLGPLVELAARSSSRFFLRWHPRAPAKRGTAESMMAFDDTVGNISGSRA